MDFEVQRCSRHCAKTSRLLAPGEVFYSTLVSQAGQVQRLDYCDAAWTGPPEGALGWWKSRMPSPNEHKPHWAPNDVILHYFERLQDDDERQDVRYVLALLMIRRRIVRLQETLTDRGGRETLVLFCGRNESQYRVDVVEPSAQRVSEIQDELAKLLFAKAS